MKRYIAPVILIVLGVLFLLSNLGIANFNFHELATKWWPLILIAVGVGLLLKRA
jgi:putative Mn2+ efflux pump MntP